MPRSRRRGDRGSASIELAVLFPVFLVLVLLTVQAVLWFHSRNVALSAAREGVRVGRLQGSSAERARQAAVLFVGQVGDGVLTAAHVDTAGSTSTEVWVRVSGTATSILPGLSPRVSQVSHGGVERFTDGTGP